MTGSSQSLRIVVLGYLVRGPLGGLAWHHLQYALGLKAMGHDVLFLEDSEDYDSCYDPALDTLSSDPTYGLQFTERALDRLGMEGSWAYYDFHRNQWHGPAALHVKTFCASADLVLNVSAVNPLREWTAQIPTRILIDTDPGFTQIRHLTDSNARRRAQSHTGFFTFAENIHSDDCLIPDDGLPWQTTRQPVVIDAWPHTPGPRNGAFTTVMQWDSYRPLEYNGLRLGMKSESFEPYRDIPNSCQESFELALGSPMAPRDHLRRLGWSVIDSRQPTRDPWTYQKYLADSKAEFSVAKHGYVITQSGWFSERTAAYLATGRPALVQDTGFSRYLPTGEGLLSFTDPGEAMDGVAGIAADYPRHCSRAREIAIAYFHSARVLQRLLDAALNPESLAQPRNQGAAP